MKKAILLIFTLGLFMSSCSVTQKTYSTRNIIPNVHLYPTVADLDVKDKVEKTETWNFSPFSYKMDNKNIRIKNLIADVVKENESDIMIKPEIVYTKKSFGQRSVTVSGYPAKISNIRKADAFDLDTLKADTLEKKHFYVLRKEDASEENIQVVQVDQRKTRFAFRVGYAMNSRMGASSTNSVLPGYTVGIEAITQLNPTMYWNIGVIFASRGYKEKSSDYYYYSSGKELRAHMFQMPVGIGGKWKLSKNLSFDLHGGFFWSCDMEGYRDDGYSYESISEISGYSRFDVGAMIGVGLWLGNFNLDCTYQPGFVIFDEDGRQNSFWVRLGYAF